MDNGGAETRIMRLVLPIALVALLAGCAAESREAPRGLAEDIVGTWRLVEYEDRDANGTVVHPYGRTPAGLLIYDAGGRMAVQIMKQPPPDVAGDDWDTFTAAEKIALWDGYVAYFGRYEVDEARNTVTHLPEADLSRLYIGRREVRQPAITGDTLILSEAWEQSGRKWSGTRRFERLR
jgi:hypothetical protein